MQNRDIQRFLNHAKKLSDRNKSSSIVFDDTWDKKFFELLNKYIEYIESHRDDKGKDIPDFDISETGFKSMVQTINAEIQAEIKQRVEETTKLQKIAPPPSFKTWLTAMRGFGDLLYSLTPETRPTRPRSKVVLEDPKPKPKQDTAKPETGRKPAKPHL